MAATSEETIMEEREELMVSPKLTQQHHPTRKIARFLKPSVTANSIDVKPYPFNPPTASSPPKNRPLKVSFNGWRTSHSDWKAWVNHMHSLHQSTWKKAGIEQAVLNSQYEITKKDDLILGFAQKWCHETNTFVFVWGEATITLEDMMVLGGYSVLGESILTPVENLESKATLAKLYESKIEFSRSSSRKADHYLWLRKFKDSGIEFEHEAFLAFWLNRFVFPSSYSTVVRNVFPIAVHLANGTRLALAPAVLATIYRDLSFLKAKIVNHNYENLVTTWAPFQLVQIWIWERFEKLSPKVSDTDHASNPRFAKWDNKNVLIYPNVNSILDCDSEHFCWRPYASNEKDDLGNEEKGRWVVVCGGDCLDEELESWGRCLRVSELVGIQGKCVEQYLPHRVAMQFGMDQDIPGEVPRKNGGPILAWKLYTRRLADFKLYIPSRFYEPCVTARYLEWRNKTTGMHSLGRPMGDDEIKTSVKDESRTERLKEYCMGGISTSDGSHNGASPVNKDEDTLGMDLEARIRGLEEVFAYLKAKKYGHELV